MLRRFLLSLLLFVATTAHAADEWTPITAQLQGTRATQVHGWVTFGFRDTAATWDGNSGRWTMGAAEKTAFAAKWLQITNVITAEAEAALSADITGGTHQLVAIDLFLTGTHLVPTSGKISYRVQRSATPKRGIPQGRPLTIAEVAQFTTMWGAMVAKLKIYANSKLGAALP